MSESNINIKIIKSKIYTMNNMNNNMNNNKNNKIIIGRYRNMMSIFNGNKGIIKPQECGSC